MSIVVNNLSYALPDGTSIFSNISFSIGRQSRCALVGANGCGKSTLMDILIKKLAPGGGEMFLSDSPYLVPQHYGQYDSLTVAEALGVDRKLTALHSIISGDASEENFILLEDDWSVEERVRSALDFWGLNHVTPDTAMSSLSGGEKTLTAIAVLFAILNIKPSPFCILDEVEAALDEANVDTFGKYLQEKKESSQFILITHKKRTMEYADVLYGITMQESGVSKIVSVNLESI